MPNWSFVVEISFPDVSKTLNLVTAVHNLTLSRNYFGCSASLVLPFLVLSAVNFFSGDGAWEKSHADSAVIGCFKRSFRSCPSGEREAQCGQHQLGNGERDDFFSWLYQ